MKQRWLLLGQRELAKMASRKQNGERIHGEAGSCWKGERNNQEHPESALPFPVQSYFSSPGPWGLEDAAGLGCSPRPGLRSTSSSWLGLPLHISVFISLLWRQKLYFPSHCLCSSGLICPLMDNLSAFGCSGSWEEIHGRVMPSALSGGFGNLTFNLFCGI